MWRRTQAEQLQQTQRDAVARAMAIYERQQLLRDSETLRVDIARDIARYTSVPWWDLMLTDHDYRFLKRLGITPWK